LVLLNGGNNFIYLYPNYKYLKYYIIISLMKFIQSLYGDWGLGIGDWGLGLGGWGQTPKPQTPNPKPQTPKEINR
jgi:hypothetical protein